MMPYTIKTKTQILVLSSKQVIDHLRLKFPKEFKKGEKVSEAKLLESYKKIEQADIDSLVFLQTGFEEPGAELVFKYPYESDIHTEWSYDKKGKITNIHFGNKITLKLELERRGCEYTFKKVEETREKLYKLEREKFAENNGDYEDVGPGYLTSSK